MMQRRDKIACEVDGVQYEGNYWVAGKILVVSTAMGGTSTQLGTHDPAALAEKLLKRLVKEGKLSLTTASEQHGPRDDRGDDRQPPRDFPA